MYPGLADFWREYIG